MKLDRIDAWSEIKLDIIREYASAYSKILDKHRLHHVYIDAFSGPGYAVSKRTGEFVAGSPLNALAVEPPFKEYHFIDLDGDKIDLLREVVTPSQASVNIYHDDCNRILLDGLLDSVKYADYRRALCLLDPYDINLNWAVIAKAGKMGTIELFINFMVMDMNRNVLWRQPERVSEERRARMTAFWGDESWIDVVYDKEPPQASMAELFGMTDRPEKRGNDAVAEAFRQRLIRVAGFDYVPEPVQMRNKTNSTMYYLFFAANKPVAAKIVTDIFSKYS